MKTLGNDNYELLRASFSVFSPRTIVIIYLWFVLFASLSSWLPLNRNRTRTSTTQPAAPHQACGKSSLRGLSSVLHLWFCQTSWHSSQGAWDWREDEEAGCRLPFHIRGERKLPEGKVRVVTVLNWGWGESKLPEGKVRVVTLSLRPVLSWANICFTNLVWGISRPAMKLCLGSKKWLLGSSEGKIRVITLVTSLLLCSNLRLRGNKTTWWKGLSGYI